MSIELAETLKRELTDKYVIVADGVPELRRFRGLTGTVKTVNMNGRALVQFNGPEDVSWYDINPAYLTLVDKPLPAKKTAEAAHAPAAKAEVQPVAAAKKSAGKSPLELARAQGAAGAKAPAGAEKKLSPLEQARQQGAAKSGADAPTPAEAPPQGGQKLSPLELARQQGAAKQAAAGSSSQTATAEPPAATAAQPAGKKLSPLELARLQGAAKRDSSS